MEQYRIITIDITQIDEEQEEMLNDIPGIISSQSTQLRSEMRHSEESIDNALKEVKKDIIEYEHDVEDIKLDHLKGDME